MTLDHNNNRHLGSMGFDHLPYGNGPQFTNPFASGGSHLYGGGMSSNNVGFDAIAKQSSRPSLGGLPYASGPTHAPPTNAPYQGNSFSQGDLVGMSQDLLHHNRPSYEPPTSSVASFAPTSAPYASSYAAVAPQDESRRLSHSYVYLKFGSEAASLIRVEALSLQHNADNLLSLMHLMRAGVWLL